MRRGRDSREVARPKGETEGGNDRDTEIDGDRKQKEMKQTERWRQRHREKVVGRMRERKDETKADWKEGKTEGHGSRDASPRGGGRKAA